MEDQINFISSINLLLIYAKNHMLTYIMYKYGIGISRISYVLIGVQMDVQINVINFR